MNNRIDSVSRLDRLVHEPARLKILLILQALGEADFLYLQKEGSFTQGNLSSHLSKLEQAGYVEISKSLKGKFPLTICALTPAGRRALADYSRGMIDVLQSANSSDDAVQGPSSPFSQHTRRLLDNP
jgi:DNA-binding MarR family transcriptional regulator